MLNLQTTGKAFVFLTLSSIFWGATAPIMKLTLGQVPLFSLAFIRMAAASIILFFALRKNLSIKREDFLMFVCAALFGVTLNIALFFKGLQLTDAINASFLVASVPIITIFAAHFFLGEKVTKMITLSAIVAFAGIFIIIGKPEGGMDPKKVLGNTLLLLATVSWVVHEIVSKKLLKKYPPEVIVFYSLAIGAISFLPFFAIEFIKNQSWLFNLSNVSIFGIIYGILFSSLFAYLLWQKGLSKLPVGQASFFFYLDPISGAILSVILLGEKVTGTLIIGGALILIGVIMAEHKRKASPLHGK